MNQEKSSHPNVALRKARKAKGYTQERLAEELSVSTITVRSWENGSRHPGLDAQLRLCELLEKQPEELGLQPASNEQEQLQNIVSPASSLTMSDDDRITESYEQHRITERAGKFPFQQWPTFLFPHHDESRARMLRRVHSRWITDVLEPMLGRTPLIELRLCLQPNAVASPWRTANIELPSGVLPAGTSITEVYDDADGELLILGEGGAGKSTLLLALARDLVCRAKLDDTHPIPVIFHLPSWKPQQLSLAVWLAEELNIKYQIPRRLAAQWIEHDQILPLLDGLDESPAQTICIEAINHYRQDHGLVSMVVCSRTSDYLSQPAHLILSRAVMVQPLAGNQVDDYLAQSAELSAMRVALEHVPVLQELCSTPLMLSILASTYAGMTVDEVYQISSLEKHRSVVFDRYVERLLRRRSPPYTDQKMTQGLAWVAQYMKRSRQTEFYLERLQPEWALPSQLSSYRSMIIRLIYGIQAITVAGLFAWLRGGKLVGPGQATIFGVGAGLLGQLGSGAGDKIFGWMAPGLGGGLDASGSLGIFLALLLPIVILLAEETPVLSWQAVWQGIVAGGRAGLFFGIPVGLVGMPFFFLTAEKASVFLDILHALSFGSSVSIFCGLIFGFLSGLLASVRSAEKEPPQMKVERSRRQKCGDAIILGGLAGGAFGLVDLMLRVEPSTTITFTMIVIGLGFGLGGGSSLIPGLATVIRPAEIVSWSFSGVKRDLGQNIVKGATIGGLIMLSSMLVIGGGSALFNGLAYGFHYGSVYGIILGLVASVAALFTTTLKSGWRSDMLSEHDHSLPNEGIKRSLKHGLLAGCIFGLIGGLASGLVAGGAFGFVGGLPGWYVLGMGSTIIFGFIFALEFGLLHGLIAVIEHYVLRWYLYRANRIPWNIARFLDEAAACLLIRKIGGGYMFSHHDVLEYFAQKYQQGELFQRTKNH